MARNQTTNRKQRESAPPKLIAYSVSDRGRGRKFWTRLGAVWEHKNGEGLTIFLNVMPIDFDGRIVLLPPRDEEEQDEGPDAGEGEAAADDGESVEEAETDKDGVA